MQEPKSKNDATANKGIDWSSLYRKEDWWAVWLGFFILALASTRIITSLPTISKWTTDPSIAISIGAIPNFILLGFALLTLTSVAIFAMKEKIKGYWIGFPLLFFLAFLAILLSKQGTIATWGLEYVLWALIFGLLISNIAGTPKWLKPATKTELFIKIGLVLYGAEILFQTFLSIGSFGVLEITVGLFLVWYFCYYLAIRVGLAKSFAAIMASATSICGVSAAIATGGAIKGDAKEVSYTISLVMLFSIPLLVIMPLIAKAASLPDAVVGAWIGGTIDTTAAVVAAGALYSAKAQQVASIIKSSQNIMIGLAAFVLALYWAIKVDRKPNDRPKPVEIWYRFPKFVLGFIVTSMVFSLLLVPTIGSASVASIVNVTKEIRGWFFTMAFVCIGLDVKFVELAKTGRGKPFLVFFAATILDLIISLLSAYAFFGGVFFPPPI